MTLKPDLFLQDLRVALRSLARTRGLAITVVLTLALGIGANAAIFSLVRGVLLRPLVNADENRLIYIRQSALGMGSENVNFSVPEIQDLKASVHTLTEFGDFSTIGFTMIGLGEPREVRAGVVGGNYFEVMGLHPVLGRLIGPQDDGPKADGVVVLTYRFWTTLKRDPSVLGKVLRLGSIGDRTATIIGVLEPSVPYPSDTEIIANIVTSPHHLSATMVTGRVHRMTELFGRLAPGVTLDQARADLRTAYASMVKDHPDTYSPKADFRIDARLLRDQITSGARNVLLVLLAASGLVFVIACSNVANLILARSVRREGELSIRAALGASTSALRRTLLAESLVLCVAGAALGVLIARPLLAVLARYASRFSVRALDLTVDASMLWVGAILAVIAAVLLAFVPHLPNSNTSQGSGLATGSIRITSGTNRRLRIFAVTQIAASFMLLAGASMLITTLISMQAAQTGLDMRRVLAINVPAMSYGKSPQQVVDFYKESIRRIEALPGVDKTAFGLVVPWRDAGNFGPGFQFSADGHVRAPGEEDPRANLRVISPGFFAALGVPIIAGRDFNELDAQSKEPVAIVSETLAKRMFPNQDAVNRHVFWTDPVMKFIPGFSVVPQRIIGVTADIDDEHVVPGPALTVYSSFEQGPMFGGRLFIHTGANPYSLVTPITRIIREMSADQPVERAATLEDVRAEVLTPDRLNTVVFGVFAGAALAIALVGVAGVLAFSVSARTREFGIRLALGSPPKRLLAGVIAEGAMMAITGVVVGAGVGYLLARFAGSYFLDVRMPSTLPVLGSGLILLVAAVVASAWPAARAARIDAMEALRSE
ncbi:MAG TPA: ADOP family duplicated permease [Candidatus Dormibacteraeota bacterium]|nr:ADOP family duplicated permease [Candidatus Dormibacteraeota bacterium]